MSTIFNWLSSVTWSVVIYCSLFKSRFSNKNCVFGLVVNDKLIIIAQIFLSWPILYYWIEIAGNGAENISYLIYNYAVSIPNLAVRFPWTLLVLSLSLPVSQALLLLRQFDCCRSGCSLTFPKFYFASHFVYLHIVTLLF